MLWFRSEDFWASGTSSLLEPWKALSLRPAEKAFFLDIPKEKLENAPGFDKDEWPNMADKDWVERIDKFYGNPGTRLNG